MHEVFSGAGRAFLKAFAASLIVLGPGLLSAPNLNQAFAVGVAGLFASVAAGLTAVQGFVPELSFAKYLPGLAGQALDSFAQGFLGALLVSIIGILNSPHLSDWRAVATAVIVGAVNAGLRGVQRLVIDGKPNPRAHARKPRSQSPTPPFETPKATVAQAKRQRPRRGSRRKT